MAKKDNDLKKYRRGELLELLIEQGRRIEELERELSAAYRALAECSPNSEIRSLHTDISTIPGDVLVTARKNARTLLLDVMALMKILETTEDDVERAEETDPQR